MPRVRRKIRSRPSGAQKIQVGSSGGRSGLPTSSGFVTRRTPGVMASSHGVGTALRATGGAVRVAPKRGTGPWYVVVIY